MDSAFTGYTPRMDSRRTPSGENGRPSRKLRPALCLQWRCRCAGPEGIVSNTLEGFLSIGLCARGMSILDTIPDTDNSLCFLRRERLVKVRMREFMIGGFRLVGIFLMKIGNISSLNNYCARFLKKQFFCTNSFFNSERKKRL